MKRLAALTLLSLMGLAAAGRDSGAVTNWNEYAQELRSVASTGAFGPLATEQEYNVLRAAFNKGRFSVTFDDRAANALAVPSPTPQICPQVKRTAGLRTTLITGVAVQLPGGLRRLTREGSSGKYTVTDVWLYASAPGRITGACAAATASAQYNLSLAQGWNAVRVYVDDTSGSSVIQNISGAPLAWKLH